MIRRRLIAVLGLSVGCLLVATGAAPVPPIDLAVRPTVLEAEPISLGLDEKPALREAGIGAQLACEETAGGEPGRLSHSALRHSVGGATPERFATTSPRHRAPVSLLALVEAAAIRRGLPVHILAGLTEDESSWRADAVGASGEVGLLQLSAGTAVGFCGLALSPFDERLDPAKNADCGARYLSALFDQFGTWDLAIAGFKAGPATIPDRIPAAAWTFAQRALTKAEAYR